MDRKRKATVNIPLCAAAVLLYLTVLSSCFVSGLFARYTTRAGGGDGARVAKFSVTGGGTLLQTIEAELYPGQSQPAELEIKNDSEVAVEYTVAVTNETRNLPLEFRLQKRGAPVDADTSGTVFTAQTLPGEHTDVYTLYIDWPEVASDPALMGQVDHITVTVTAAQID